MNNILALICIASATLLFCVTSGHAQDIPPAVPMDPVQAEILQAPVKASVKILGEKTAASTGKSSPIEGRMHNGRGINFIAIPIPPAKPATQSGALRKPAPEKAPPPSSAAPSYENITVMELFSSQYCAVCPDADRFLTRYMNQDDVIALACHVNDIKDDTNNLTLPFCASRQSAFNAALHLGAGYASQLIINGKYDALGFDPEDVQKTVTKVQQNIQTEPVIKLTIDMQSNKIFSTALPELDANIAGQGYKIWLISYDRPKTVKINQGVNTNKTFTYNNIVSNAGFLGAWDGASKILRFDPKLRSETKGFAILVQNELNNQIIAAGKYENLNTPTPQRLAQSSMLPMIE